MGSFSRSALIIMKAVVGGMRGFHALRESHGPCRDPCITTAGDTMLGWDNCRSMVSGAVARAAPGADLGQTSGRGFPASRVAALLVSLLGLLLVGCGSWADRRAIAAQPGTVTTTTLLRVAFTSPLRGVGLFVRSMVPENGASTGGCAFFTRTITDGGAGFGRAGATIRTTGCGLGYLVAGIAADGAGDVFAYDPGLFESHDGGASWKAVRLGGTVVALTPSGRSVWVLRESGCPRGNERCTLTLLVSADGGRSWRPAVHQPPERRLWPGLGAGGALTSLLRSSATAASIVLPPARGSSAARVEQTVDGGVRWTTGTAPCLAAAWVIDYSVATTGARWIACAGEPGAGEQLKTFARSFDGGRTWRAGSTCMIGTRCERGMPLGGYLGELAAISAKTAFYVGERSSLTATRDGGRSWTAEPGFSGDASGTAEVTFAGADDGWAIDEGFGGHAVLWRTRDGGTRWTRLKTR